MVVGLLEIADIIGIVLRNITQSHQTGVASTSNCCTNVILRAHQRDSNLILTDVVEEGAVLTSDAILILPSGGKTQTKRNALTTSR